MQMYADSHYKKCTLCIFGLDKDFGVTLNICQYESNRDFSVYVDHITDASYTDYVDHRYIHFQNVIVGVGRVKVLAERYILDVYKL